MKLSVSLLRFRCAASSARDVSSVTHLLTLQVSNEKQALSFVCERLRSMWIRTGGRLNFVVSIHQVQTKSAFGFVYAR
jgi:hypothetical protein